MTENFIRIYDDILPNRLIEDFTSMANQTVTWNNRNDVDKSDFQMPLDPFWPKLVKECNEIILNRGLVPYLDDFPYLKSYDWSSGVMLLQKTEPLQGYHTFHSENLAWHGHNRTLAWMLYLNDIEEGGETEFLYQQLKIKPKRNTGVIWSGGFTHLHRGNPPISGTKYILTGWFASPHPDPFNIS
tara:strand:+ start:41 stop:595 length:555 start_codon:yes stop_codon:yes gene_type:complete